MSSKPTSSGWADDLSDDDYAETSRLIKNNRANTYQSTQQNLIDHEEGLDRLGEAIRRQKNVASELATEVDLHNEILDDIDTGMTNTNENLQKNTRNIRLISKKSSTFCLWFLIVLLAVVIVALAII